MRATYDSPSAHMQQDFTPMQQPAQKTSRPSPPAPDPSAEAALALIASMYQAAIGTPNEAGLRERVRQAPGGEAMLRSIQQQK